MTPYEGYNFVKVDNHDGVAVCVMNRPEKLNAINREAHRELERLFAQLAADADVKAVVLSGAGRAFCAGGDISGMGTASRNEGGGIFDSGARQLVASLLSIEQPVIAAVNGDAVGLGATLALLCDIVFMAETARIGDTHVKVGLVPGDGGAIIWPLLIGPSRAKEYLLTGDLISGPEAERMGLVNHVVPANRVLDDAVALATRLAEGATLAIRFTKIAIQRALLQSALNNMDIGLALEALTGQSADHAEAVKAFREKRAPAFEGR